MKEVWVLKSRYTSPDGETGTGYITPDGKQVTISPGYAAKFSCEAEVWDFAIVTENLGRDQDGEWCWPELLSPATECTDAP